MGAFINNDIEFAISPKKRLSILSKLKNHTLSLQQAATIDSHIKSATELLHEVENIKLPSEESAQEVTAPLQLWQEIHSYLIKYSKINANKESIHHHTVIKYSKNEIIQ